MFFVFIGVILFFIWPRYTKHHFLHLDGLWYLEISSGRIGQWLDPFRFIHCSTRRVFKKDRKPSMMQSLLDAFGKLECGKDYWTHTHLIEHLERYGKRKRITIISSTPIKKRFVYEYIFSGTKEACQFLKDRIAKGAKNNKKIYRQFYKVHFIKLK